MFISLKENYWLVIERRLNRQWKLTELSLKCACHSAHFSHWKVAESRISAKTEMWVFFLCGWMHGHLSSWIVHPSTFCILKFNFLNKNIDFYIAIWPYDHGFQIPSVVVSAAKRNHLDHPESHGRHPCLRGGSAKHQTAGGPCVQAAYRG